MEISIKDTIKENILNWFSVDVIARDDLPKPKVPMQFRSKIRLEWLIVRGHTFLAMYLEDSSLLSKSKRGVFNHLLTKISTEESILVISASLTSEYTRYLSGLNIAYVTANKMAYIPQLFFVCEEPQLTEEIVATPKFKQVRLLEAHILISYMAGDVLKEALSKDIPIHCSRSAKSRALKSLENMGYITLDKVGRNTSITFTPSRFDLWDNRKNIFPKLSSGLRMMERTVFDAMNLDSEDLIISGESALSANTLWSKPFEPSYAVTVKNKDNLPLSSHTLYSQLKREVLNALESGKLRSLNPDPVMLEKFGYEPHTVIGPKGIRVLSPLFLAIHSTNELFGDTRGSLEKMIAKVEGKLISLDEIDNNKRK